MNILITGAAGFIGAATVERLLRLGHKIIGIDNINSYYDPALKYRRLTGLGIEQDRINDGNRVTSKTNPAFSFIKMDLTDRKGLGRLFEESGFETVINLAAQAGVRYSLENPYAYIESNIVGFINILECCRHHPVKHLIYASSSSVYGMSDHVPYSEADRTDSPVSLYAATKKSNELMAYCYSRLYGIPATGVRFFTVYGPAGRPDMAPFLFLRAVLEGKQIRVFNHGDMQRDFTYIDDITDGLMLLLEHPSEEEIPHRVYNIGHSSPVQLMDFIHTIERVAGRKADMRMEGMQPGDVYCTFADTTRLHNDFGYEPKVSIDEGIQKFYDWYVNYAGIERRSE